MPTLARKFLMAGRGGLNLTHSENLATFLTRYGADEAKLAPMIRDFSPQDLMAWCEGLGQKTFTGSSGRVFPATFKASPLLRAWLQRLDTLGVKFHMKRTWKGWGDDGELLFEAPGKKQESVTCDALILALGGGSWAKLGSDGSWVWMLEETGARVERLLPANCGFDVKWSEHFRRYEGQPLKPIALSFNDKRVHGEAMITTKGIEGGVVYALSRDLRDAIQRIHGAVTLAVDLKPDLTVEALTARFNKVPRGRQPLTAYLRKAANLSDVAISLIHEVAKKQDKKLENSGELVSIIKHLPLTLTNFFKIDRAISTAGGVAFESLDENLMLKTRPGVFVAGEMLDWEAPTGGYLLQGCFSTAVRAANGALQFLKN
jgi:uncharacterized flavoprotein (TIGR03862 family)